ncbi:hypothetical protein Tco_0924612 [Tanacetum coccineum]|uniref:Xylulose kinase-1 n=1 Tax=Tanacetum coccineum TaxID=301880 RepID=A0ABQ5D597_9ASTR
MANLEFCDIYNMVAYLKKLEGSEEFHQIVDFLNASHIRYALTENPTIYVSLIKQFWKTATAKTLDTGEVELTATIDGKVKIVIEASVKKHLQLADFDGISSLPNTEIFEQLSLMGRTIRQEYVVPQPRSPTQTHVADKATSTGVDVRYGGVVTTVIGLKAGQGSGNIDKTRTIPQDLPLPRVNILGSDEGSLTLYELTVLCITLSRNVESLETDLKQTNLTYGATYTKLIKKVKKIENKVKSNQARRRARIVVSDDEEDLEDPSKQGRKISEIDQEPTISLGRQKHDIEFEFDLDACRIPINTSTSYNESRIDQEKRKKRIARVHEAASSFNVEEWEDIQARVEADEELAQEHLGGYTLQQLRGYSFDEIKNLFKTTMRRVHTFVPIKSEIERVIPELAAGSLKRDAEEELSKRQKNYHKNYHMVIPRLWL